MLLTGSVIKAADRTNELNLFILFLLELNACTFDAPVNSFIQIIASLSVLRRPQPRVASPQVLPARAQRCDQSTSDSRAVPQFADLPCRPEYYRAHRDRMTAFLFPAEAS